MSYIPRWIYMRGNNEKMLRSIVILKMCFELHAPHFRIACYNMAFGDEMRLKCWYASWIASTVKNALAQMCPIHVIFFFIYIYRVEKAYNQHIECAHHVNRCLPEKEKEKLILVQRHTNTVTPPHSLQFIERNVYHVRCYLPQLTPMSMIPNLSIHLFFVSILQSIYVTNSLHVLLLFSVSF